MAQALADATPPEGVKVSDPSTLIQASDPAQVLTQIVIEFVPQFSATVLAGWILLALANRREKRTRINRKDVALKEADIVRLIEEQLDGRRDTKMRPNQALEQTATRFALTSWFAKTISLRATRAPGGRRSACSR